MKIAKHSGFTLIELIVVIAIIGILSATAIVNFGKNDDRDVRMEKDRLTAYLREVQNKALAGERKGIGTGSKVCGFGVNQQGDSTIQTYYIVAANLDTVCSDSTTAKTYDSSHVLDAFHFANNVKISGTFSDIFFLSPYGVIYSAGSPLAGTVNISLNKGSLILNNIVSVDAAGKIY